MERIFIRRSSHRFQWARSFQRDLRCAPKVRGMSRRAPGDLLEVIKSVSDGVAIAIAIAMAMAMAKATVTPPRPRTSLSVAGHIRFRPTSPSCQPSSWRPGDESQRTASSFDKARWAYLQRQPSIYSSGRTQRAESPGQREKLICRVAHEVRS